MLNFVYAIDKNYNIQAYTSINSVLRNIDKKINIFIMHEEPETFDYFAQNLSTSSKIEDLKIIKINIDIDLPNLEGSHVSKATYFRIFFDKHLPKNIENVIYIDADIICTGNPVIYLEQVFTELKKSENLIAARTDLIKNENNLPSEIFERLELSSSKYFNAGLLVFNHKEWLENSIYLDLQSELKNIYKKIKYWDQDVLNSYFDGKYLEISSLLNFPVNPQSMSITAKSFLQSISFIHFQGNKKPWNLDGIFLTNSIIYQNAVLDTTIGSYHIVPNNLIKDLFFIFANLIKGNSKNIDIITLIKSYFKFLNFTK